MKYYLAIDIGASSGRHIVGWTENGEIQTEEVYRFKNGVVECDGHLTWDAEYLFKEVKTGIRVAMECYPIESLSIDTWGVDYVLLKQGREVLPMYAYRDSRTTDAIEAVHKRVPFSELYRRTGCQFQPFTTIYQLYDDLQQGRLEGVTDMLMTPEYLMYKLTGVKKREFTEGTTTGLVDAASGTFDTDLCQCLGLPICLFPELSQPGSFVGYLLPEVQCEVGGNCKVVLCATHDTASAVEGIPMVGNQPYISSGTWSLLGVKTSEPITNKKSEATNYSNEGGVGYNRYQKNIMGMWLINELRRDICPELNFPEIVEAARKSNCNILVDANDPLFLAPDSMKAAFDQATDNSLETTGDYFRCAYRSLAECYRTALEEMEANTHRIYDKVYIVGGGAKNQFLNELTERFTGKKIIALPIEATAIGNLIVQIRADEENTYE